MRARPFNSNRAWLVIFGLLVVFIACGPYLEHKDRIVSDLYDVAIVTLPLSALLYTVIYTVLGFRGRSKWWREDVGMAIVTPYIAVIFSGSMLAWAALFNKGMLTASWQAWVYIGGVLAGGWLMLWRSWVWLATSARFRTKPESPEGPAEAATAEKD